VVPAREAHDVVIVGAGVAGLSCALECVDVRLDAVVLEADAVPGGQVAEIPHSVRNVATARYTDGAALQRSLEERARELGVRLRLEQRVTRANLAEHFVEADDVQLGARALVLATGTARHYLAPAVDGAFGGDVTYQLESRRGHFTGRPVVVIGGGDSATLDALELAEAGSDVKLVHRSPQLSARHDILEAIRRQPRIEDLAGWELDSVAGDDRLHEVVVRRPDGATRRLAAGGLVVKVGRLPRTELFRGQLTLDCSGAIVVDGDLRTSCAGVFAAGDVVAGAYPRVATALGQGVLVARSVLRHVQEGV
jgi:thioredoxin reductase (NADPH)